MRDEKRDFFLKSSNVDWVKVKMKWGARRRTGEREVRGQSGKKRKRGLKRK